MSGAVQPARVQGSNGLSPGLRQRKNCAHLGPLPILPPLKCHRSLFSLPLCSPRPPPAWHSKTFQVPLMLPAPKGAQALGRCCLVPPTRYTFHVDTLPFLKLGPHPNCPSHSRCCWTSDFSSGFQFATWPIVPPSSQGSGQNLGLNKQEVVQLSLLSDCIRGPPLRACPFREEQVPPFFSPLLPLSQGLRASGPSQKCL